MDGSRAVLGICNIENVHLTTKSSSSKISVEAGVKDKSKNKTKQRNIGRKKNAIESQKKIPDFKNPSKLKSSVVPRREKVCGYIAMTLVEKEDRDLAKVSR